MALIQVTVSEGLVTAPQKREIAERLTDAAASVEGESMGEHISHRGLAFSSAERAERLARLVYELLDAHADTDRLMRGPSTELAWRAHHDYLRDLQRIGREVLARAV